MAQNLPATVGMMIDEIDTPAIVVDLDIYERNLEKMKNIIEPSGKRLRPHAKMHKSPEIALEQIEKGAVGVCCQKLSEAEIMVEGGVKDVLITNQIVSPSKLKRVAKLALKAEVGICVDDASATEMLNVECAVQNANISVYVEIDVGGHRCGLGSPIETVNLAKLISNLSHLKFEGLQAYHGSAQHWRTPQERAGAVKDAANIVTQHVDALKEAGINCNIVTGGGTGTLIHDLNHDEWNELQCGSYAFMDADYGKNIFEGAQLGTGFEHSLFVQTTVISTAVPNNATTDAGLKALASDSGNPVIHGYEHLNYRISSDEHGCIAISHNDIISLGDRLMLIPGHCDPTVNLYDWYVGIRGGIVEKVWPVAARGALS
jgi:3-hydroxy-D-aspartate aldolase